ncbi:MAG: zinc-binding dehydrogenase [Thermomicrobiales bacterium]
MAVVAVRFTGVKTVGFETLPERPVGPGEVRLRTLYSGISAGTELTAYRGTNPYLHKRWDAGQRLFLAIDAGMAPEPPRSWGYEEVGEIVDVGPGVTDLTPGTLVHGTWGHQTEHVARAEDVGWRTLPAGTDPILGIFSHIGPIALNGVLDGAIRLGETVAVFGLGVVGQLVVRLARLSGATVVGIDPIAARRDLAAVGGAATTIGPEGAAEAIRDLTGGLGADVCFEASGSARALHEAIRACAPSSRVVTLGFFQGEATGLLLGDEFHHNRITLVCSQIGGVAPELRHRWDRDRLVRTFMGLVTDGTVDPRPLVSHVLPAARAADAYALLDERPGEALQVVLDFRDGLQMPGGEVDGRGE